MKKLAFILFAALAFASCGGGTFIPGPEEPEVPVLPEDPPTDNKVVKPLKLSVENSVWIDDVEFEFDILSGNGGYTATVSKDNRAIVAIEGDKVKIDMLACDAWITISDEEEQSVSFLLSSSDWSVRSTAYVHIMEIGKTAGGKLDFGAGGFTVSRVRGSSADVVVDENDELQITSITGGTSYFRIKDRRGSVAPLTVKVISYYELTENAALNIEAARDESITVALKYGVGDWRVLAYSEPTGLLENIKVHKNGDSVSGCDTLQLNIGDTDITGDITVTLIDSANNMATVHVMVR